MPRDAVSILGEVDPSAPGTIVRIALVLESVATIGVGSYYLLFPRHYLRHTMGVAATQVTTTAIQGAQQFGAVNILAGTAVGLFASNTRNAFESRRPLYTVLLVWELFFIPLVVGQAFLMEGGMQKESLLAYAAQFVPVVLWRIFTLGWKPEWFGQWLEGKKTQ